VKVLAVAPVHVPAVPPPVQLRTGAAALLYRLVAVKVPVSAVGAQTVPLSGLPELRSVTPRVTSAQRLPVGAWSTVPMLSVKVLFRDPVLAILMVLTVLVQFAGRPRQW